MNSIKSYFEKNRIETVGLVMIIVFAMYLLYTKYFNSEFMTTAEECAAECKSQCTTSAYISKYQVQFISLSCVLCCCLCLFSGISLFLVVRSRSSS